MNIVRRSQGGLWDPIGELDRIRREIDDLFDPSTSRLFSPDRGLFEREVSPALDIEEREVVSMLGPNGAGKTTTTEILEGYRGRDSGGVSVLGFDPASGGRPYRERIGIVLQEAGFEDQFQNVDLGTGTYDRPASVIEPTGSSDVTVSLDSFNQGNPDYSAHHPGERSGYGSGKGFASSLDSFGEGNPDHV